jgi:hypothetical protein
MYFAELNDNKIVKRVIVADSKEWCEENLGGTWVKTHDPLDAAIGYEYNEDSDKFIAPVQIKINEDIAKEIN